MVNFSPDTRTIPDSHLDYDRLKKELEKMEDNMILEQAYSEPEKPALIPPDCVTQEFLDKQGNKKLMLFGFKDKEGHEKIGIGVFVIGQDSKYLSQENFNKMLKKAREVFEALEKAKGNKITNS